ncbi:hypothetical protein [Streptomyces sp. NP-1717]|uniref:effector-associated constant component EACC1 n=1 Tax=Streptomyces sp. NP-1717 TaxID=2704470 RepID=UPI001F5D53FB|nr:hypothetical protein [Streptomyces sp. NP-1717]MCI3223144.1 hypothetical protein [Streptomyces sp. NP-1717]
MQVQISVEGDALSLTHLHSWLQRDPGTRRIPMTVASLSRDEMSTFDVIDLLLGNGIAAANLAVAIAAWRSARGAALNGRTVRLECGGTSVTVTDASAEDIERILRGLRESGTVDDGESPEGDAG